MSEPEYIQQYNHLDKFINFLDFLSSKNIIQFDSILESSETEDGYTIITENVMQFNICRTMFEDISKTEEILKTVIEKCVDYMDIISGYIADAYHYRAPVDKQWHDPLPLDYFHRFIFLSKNDTDLFILSNFRGLSIGSVLVQIRRVPNNRNALYDARTKTLYNAEQIYVDDLIHAYEVNLV